MPLFRVIQRTQRPTLNEKLIKLLIAGDNLTYFFFYEELKSLESDFLLIFASRSPLYLLML